MGYKIFMTSFKILKLLWISELIVKKININYKIFSQTSISLFTIGVNHNEQYNGRW
jgi:hypothetical protein